MAAHDEYYSDFSNRKPFNNIPCRKDEVLAPVVVDNDYKDYLRTWVLTGTMSRPGITSTAGLFPSHSSR